MQVPLVMTDHPAGPTGLVESGPPRLVGRSWRNLAGKPQCATPAQARVAGFWRVRTCPPKNARHLLGRLAKSSRPPDLTVVVRPGDTPLPTNAGQAPRLPKFGHEPPPHRPAKSQACWRAPA